MLNEKNNNRDEMLESRAKFKAEEKKLFLEILDGVMEACALKIFTDEDIAKIADKVLAWKSSVDYEDIAGFFYSASLEDIKTHGYVLTP